MMFPFCCKIDTGSQVTVILVDDVAVAKILPGNVLGTVKLNILKFNKTLK